MKYSKELAKTKKSQNLENKLKYLESTENFPVSQGYIQCKKWLRMNVSRKKINGFKIRRKCDW